VTFTGGANAVGFFKNAEEEIGIDRGLIMTSGSAASVMGNIGIDNNGSVFASTGNATGGGDPDLQSLTTNNILDLCRYEITFIPTSDTVQFKYVFASEEYPEYACSPFNDVFGFFISGPGINGPYANNAENIAIIPGTNLPVTINNLHPQNGAGCPPVNDQFYNDNNGSSMQPVYDGFTDVFVAQAVVVPCEQYTIKLAISDAGDTAFDSGVFLEAKSFGSPSLQVDVLTQSLDGTISEECSDATLCISLPRLAEADYPIDFTIFGTATNGVDYSTIPDTLTILQGDSVVCIDITAFEDGITEGTEFIGIDIQRDVCNRDTFYINIRENELISPDLGPDLELCQTDTIQLDGTINIPLPPPPSFTNTNDVFINPPMTSVYSSIDVFGVQPFELGPGVIQSVCVNIDHNWLSDLDLFLVAPSGLFMELSTDNGSNGDDMIETCFTPTATTPIDYISPPATGAPYTGDFAVEGVWEDLWGAADDLTNGEWNLLMIDDQNGFAGTLLDWTITFEPLYQIYYEGTPSAGLSCNDCPDPLSSPDTTTTYVLRAYDSYGCEVFDTITITVDQVLPAPVVTCGLVTNDCITFEWTAIPGASGYLVNVDNTFFEFSNGTTSHTVCGLTFEQTVQIQVLGIDDCNGLIGTAECTTPACDGAIPSVDAINDASCFGEADGSVQLSASGSFPPFTFSLGAETNDTGLFTDLPGGIYTVTVTNSAPCGVTIDVVIPEPDSILVNDVVINDIECFDAANGSATVNVDGGVYPYTFAWNDGSADSLRTGLDAGIYTVVVTDANGCTGLTDIEITEPELLELDFDTDVVTCFEGSDGTATVLPIGGVEPYSIQWDANANNQVTEEAIDLPAGTYSVI
ncbi:MAG: choice-of-anchor L domain-containing protein, partial [Phaeodactylibacter sp.]|nr:choice-of-anchor L domain-containing protein [Phaeodactylibacter sp.]